MPVHVASWALSQLVSLSGLLRFGILILILAVVRQAALGIDPNRLLDRLVAESQASDEAEEAQARREDGGTESAEQDERLRRLNLDRGRPRVAPVRDLHGRVFIIASGGLETSVGLQVADALLQRGAQLIILDPRPLSHPVVLQLVHLLRTGPRSLDGVDEDSSDAAEPDENQSVYAEQCDLTDLHSVESFVKRWEQLLRPDSQKGAGEPRDPRTAPSGQADANSLQAVSSPARRLDSIIFLPSQPAYSLGSALRLINYAGSSTAGPDSQEVEREHALALGRLHLILSLVPSLTLLPKERDIRVINAVGPWYAAAAAITTVSSKPPRLDPKAEGGLIPGFTSAELDWTASGVSKQKRFSRWAPHLPGALTDLTWLALATYLQHRLDVLAGELSGSDASEARSRSNIRVLTVSTGFERTSTLAMFLPAADAFAGTNLLLHRVWFVSRLALWLLLQPLAMLLLRSSRHSANEVLWAVRAPVRAGMPLAPSLTDESSQVHGTTDGGPKLRPGEGVVPGKLHYQGNVVRTPLPPVLQKDESLRALYRQEEARARALLALSTPAQT